MSISKRLIKHLEENKYTHEFIEHKTTYTAWDVSQTEKVKPREVAKTLVLKVDKEIVLAVLPADRNLDKKKFLKIFNTQKKKAGEKCAKKVDFAKEVWMKKNIIGKVGATPPLGKFLKLNLFVDNLLLKGRKIYVGSGEYDTSIRLSTSQYLKKEEPTKGSFSQKK